MDLKTLYTYLEGNEDESLVSHQMITNIHWLLSAIGDDNLDPKTGNALPLNLSYFLRRAKEEFKEHPIKDRLWHLVDHSKNSVKRICGSLSEEPRRESMLLPIRSVRELDTSSFIALSRRPGRNIREKLSDKPYMKAVKHYMSIDTIENRLFKAYVIKVVDALELRRLYLKEEDDLLPYLKRWLRSDEAASISKWENFPPNNTLISHRDYRRIWDSWVLLQNIDVALDNDFNNVLKYADIKSHWQSLSEEYSKDNKQIAEVPLYIDWKNYIISTYSDIYEIKNNLVPHNIDDGILSDKAICIDLIPINPKYCTEDEVSIVNDNFVWQRWEQLNKYCPTVDLTLFESDAVMFNEKNKTIMFGDLLFSDKVDQKIANAAAYAFCKRLSERFVSDDFVWLMPDYLSEFKLETVRRNINATYKNANPLPCSVAAVFENISYDDISKNGFKVSIIEEVNGVIAQTEMVARYDKKLERALPETHGYVWEKSVTDIIKKKKDFDRIHHDFSLVDNENNWISDYNEFKILHKNNKHEIKKSNDFDVEIYLKDRPVSGGLKLFNLQKKCPNIILWRNHIPELKTELIINEILQPFYFVDKNVTVEPVRGKAVNINVPQEFTLPAGKKFYKLPLKQGTNKDALEYMATLQSPDFPYAEDVPCKLDMTYTYGDDDPYKLTFIPLNNKYKKIDVKWQLRSEIELDDAPGPKYPEKDTWEDVMCHYNPNKNENSDLVDWLLRSLSRFEEILGLLNNDPIVGAINAPWRENSKGNSFTFIETSETDYYCNQNNLSKATKIDKLTVGSAVYFYVESFKGKEQASYVGHSLKTCRYDVFNRAMDFAVHSLFVPFIYIWKDGKSLSDENAPDSLKNKMIYYIELLYKYAISEFPFEKQANILFFFLCCVGKDLPDYIAEDIINRIKENKMDERGIGFVLGDLSTSWQKEIYKLVVSKINGKTLRVLSHAIWRNENFVNCIDYELLLVLCDKLTNKIHGNTKKIITNKKKINKSLMNSTINFLELLLGLLRTRDSVNPDVRDVLQPKSEFCKILNEDIMLLSANAVKRNLCYFSRIQLDLSMKPENDKTPDLLYALRIYLSGDDTANAIKITGVIEEED